MICYAFDSVSQDLNKHDAPSRTSEIIKHEIQPEFNSEIDSPITSNSQFVSDSYKTKVQNFSKESSPWKLISCKVSKRDLIQNINNYQILTDEIKDEINGNVFYYENNGKALLCKVTETITPMYFGAFSLKGDDILLSHEVHGCPNCSKTITYSRTINDNKLTLKVQDEDEDKSDVFYVLTFIK